VLVSVADTGSGMDRQTQARIFEPFFTTKAPGRGTGIGLATVWGIVTQSGGFVTVYSELGRGTVFRIYLPRTDEPAEADRPATRREPLPPVAVIGGTETILLVEDDDDLRKATRRILRSRGYTVVEAASGGDALRLAETHPTEIHLVLTDLVMPQMSARELVARLRQVRTEIAVVFMSGYSDAAAQEQGLVEATDRFLAKPFAPPALLEAIRRALDKV
jgi:two-component system, cell cycle sensor histidine kinase and response regulator CckA